METKQLGTTEQDLALAGELLRQGQLVAFPTETVYGLGADALNETAVAQIYAAKGRPSDNPLIVHVAEKKDIAPLVREIPEKAKKLFDRFFPGPLTVILPKSDKIGKVVSGGLDTVAVRMPENPVAHRLLQLAGVPATAAASGQVALAAWMPGGTTPAEPCDVVAEFDLSGDGELTSRSLCRWDGEAFRFGKSRDKIEVRVVRWLALPEVEKEDGNDD